MDLDPIVAFAQVTKTVSADSELFEDVGKT